MQETKGHCKHGEFTLRDGCPQCLAERQGEIEAEAREQGAMERLTGVGEEELESEEELEQAPFLKQVEEDIGAVEPAAETALVPKLGEDVEVTNYYEQAVKLQEYAESRVIATVEDIKIATDDLAIIARLKKAMEEKRKEYLKPLQETVKAINDNYKFWMVPIEAADSITRDKILAFTKEQDRIRQEQEEVNRLRLEAAEAEMRLKGEITELVNLIEVAPEAPKRVSTETGTVGQRMIRKWELLDFAQVPYEYLILDSAKIGKVVRAGIPYIPGIRIYEEPILTVNAR